MIQADADSIRRMCPGVDLQSNPKDRRSIISGRIPITIDGNREVDYFYGCGHAQSRFDRRTNYLLMRIVNVETFLVGNPWKNWLFVRVETDEGIYGIGEGSLGHLSKTVNLQFTR